MSRSHTNFGRTIGGVSIVALVFSAGARPAAGQTGGDGPRVEVGARVAALMQSDGSRIAPSAHVTFNIDRRTSIDVFADVGRNTQRSQSYAVSSQVGGVLLRRSLHVAGPSRFFVSVGAVFGQDRVTFLGYSFRSANGQVTTVPPRTSRTGSGGFSAGIGYTHVLNRALALTVESQFRLMTERVGIRTAAGVSVPIGRFARVRPASGVRHAGLSQVNVGNTAWVTLADGREWTGEVVDVSATAVALRHAGRTTSLAIDDVIRIQTPDGLLDGAGIGAAIGLAAGIPAFVVGTSYEGIGFGTFLGLAWGGIGAGVGAVIGALSDSLHEGRRTVYDRTRSASVRLTPMAIRKGAALRATIRW